jgi:hypothetical protein
MGRRRFRRFAWAGAVCALGIVLGGCTAGGQFDPTEVLSNDMFNTKKKISGDREPLFPNGVPGAETGVPPDLVKGYQPPPEQAAVETPDAAAKAAAAAEKPKPKPKPKPAVARATPPAAQTPLRGGSTAWPAPQQQAPPPTNWPSPSGGQPAPSAQTSWPAPPSTAQTNWPATPPAGQAPSGTNWPAPPAPATSSH